MEIGGQGQRYDNGRYYRFTMDDLRFTIGSAVLDFGFCTLGFALPASPYLFMHFVKKRDTEGHGEKRRTTEIFNTTATLGQ